MVSSTTSLSSSVVVVRFITENTWGRNQKTHLVFCAVGPVLAADSVLHACSMQTVRGRGQEKKVGRDCPSKSASVSLHHVRLYVCLSGHACMCVLSVCTSVCMGMQADSERESLLVCVCMYNTRVPIAVVEFAVGEDMHALPMELVVLELPCTWLMHFCFCRCCGISVECLCRKTRTPSRKI